MTKYNKTQYNIFLSIFLFVTQLFILYAAYYQVGSNPIPFLVAAITLLILLVVIALFYKLNISIDNQKIVASFGIGLLKKSINLKDIAINSIEKVKMPWYYGIGIRLTPKGWLWNMKFGDAIYFKTNNKTFLVGTDDFDTIIKILKK